MPKLRQNKIDLDEKEIIRLYTEENQTIQDICKFFNVNFGTIKLRLIKNSIPLRSASESKKIVMNRPEVKKKTSEASKRSSEKRKKTNLIKYGTVVPANNTNIKEKWHQEYIENYGIEYHKDPKRIVKTKSTCLVKYGVENVSQTEENKLKISQKRWKNKTEEELNDIQEKSINTFFKNNSLDKIYKILDYCNIELLEPFKGMIKQHKYKCKKCGNIFSMSFNTIRLGEKCQNCFPRKTQYQSSYEKEIIAFLNSEITTNIVKNSRQLISPYEIDIFLPENKLAIEFDGLWYHSEQGPNSINSCYHLNKTNECEKKNIRLIHIFEDEWIFKQDIVKERLKYIFGNDKEKIYARKCEIKEISAQEKNKFLDNFHIQGKDISSINLGLYYNDILVSVMTFSKGNIAKGSKSKDGVWELNRFCSDYNYHVVGGAGKLLKHFQRNYKWIKIFSYADRRWSNGNLYYKLGFDLYSITRPNYWYVKGIQRIHRFNLRKRPDEPKDIPEWVLRNKEGYYRIWDCGNLKFLLNNPI